MQLKLLLGILLSTLLTFSNYTAFSQEITLHQVNKEYQIGKSLQILVDEDKTISFKDIKSGKYDTQFEKSEADVPNYAYLDANFWFKINLNDESNEESRWYLESSRTQIDTINVYFQNDNGDFTEYASGDLYPYDSRIIKHKNFIFPIPKTDSGQQTIYIWCKGNFSKQFPFTIIEERTFAESSHKTDLTMGILFGVFIAMVIYNLLLFFSLRSLTYLYYVLYMGSFLLAMMALTGYGYEMLFNYWLRFANISNMFFIALTVLFASQFTRRFLSVKKYSKIFHYALLAPEAYSIFLIIVSLTGIWIDGFVLFASKSAAYCGMIGVLVFLPTGIGIYRKGSRPAYFYLVAWTALFIGVIIYVLKNNAILPQNTFTDMSIIIGAVAEAILLSLGMADRIKTLEKEQRASQEKMIETLQENEDLIKNQNQILEQKVAERTSEIMEKNVEIEQQLEEIAAQRDMLSATKLELERQNDNVTSSINYAQRIQKAMLPQEDRIQNVFRESFIMFRPRDIVSGDFYWYTEMDGKKIFTVADCTGHGVPGAFMSMIGINLLNEIINVRNVTDSGSILYKLNEGVQKSLKQESSNNKDGMDMTLIVIDEEQKSIQFSGAKNPLVYVQNGELHVIKGNSNPIGGISKNGNRDYETHTIPYEKDMMVYMFSDGFQDQFGGPDDKKYMVKRFKVLLHEIANKPTEKQITILNQELDAWMKNTRQLDDILVAGIRL
jgi:serine phosphatase RsbU (regulator of sigma subunit)